MPIKVISLKNINKIIILLIIFFINACIISESMYKKQISKIQHANIQNEVCEKKEKIQPEFNIKIVQKEKVLAIPDQYKNLNIIGKLEIPKINLITYIIGETTEKSLSKSVTKLYGPDVNKVGNLCITGHNYINSKMFWQLRKLQIGDEIKLTDLYNFSCIYRIYDIYKVEPNDTSCLNQQTRRRTRSYINYMYSRCNTEINCKGSRGI